MITYVLCTSFQFSEYFLHHHPAEETPVYQDIKELKLKQSRVFSQNDYAPDLVVPHVPVLPPLLDQLPEDAGHDPGVPETIHQGTPVDPVAAAAVAEGTMLLLSGEQAIATLLLMLLL